MERWNPPYAGEMINEINGIALPEDYLVFMHVHNGGVLARLEAGDEFVLTIFPLDEVISGERYRENGCWLGSERSASQEYRILTHTRTTLDGDHPADASALYKAFLTITLQ